MKKCLFHLLRICFVCLGVEENGVQISWEKIMEMLVEALAEETVAAKRRGVHTPYGRQPRTNGRRRLVSLRGIDFITASYFV